MEDTSATTYWIDGILKDLIHSPNSDSIPQLTSKVRECLKSPPSTTKKLSTTTRVSVQKGSTTNAVGGGEEDKGKSKRDKGLDFGVGWGW
ncbi:hypothetical protein SESBI_46083 [Sesbania bispinosa]|nr:hypothetical protein SESBI_46083 [Sesbania bispinosa]